MSDVINIVFVFDDKFTDLFLVAILSIDKNTNSKIAIYVVDCGISEKSKRLILDFKSELKNITSIEFRKASPVEVFDKFKMTNAFSLAIFYRLQIGEIFPELDRFIYLDCDIISEGDVFDLWNEQLHGRAFGVVSEDINILSCTKRKKTLGIPLSKNYFNSGMFLVDSKKFKEAKVFERVLNFISEATTELKCPEQDAMNVCLGSDEYIELSPKYNFILFGPLSKKCLKKIKTPVIIHYAGAKPSGMDKKTIKVFHSLGICRYTTSMLFRFWKYADEIDQEKYSSKDFLRTIRFFYKRLFQFIERCFKKIFREKIKFLCSLKSQKYGNR